MKRQISITLIIICLSLSTFAENESTREQLPIQEIKLFTEAFHQIRENYVTEVTDKQLINLAIKGMLNGLDPHSDFLSKDDYLNLKEDTSGEFGGIGVEVTLDNGFITILAPIDDTPAAKADLRPGDIIVKIDNHSVQGSNLDESVNLLRGKKGSEVILTIMRKNADKPLTFTLKREIIKVRSVKTHWIEEDFIYLRIAQFQENTPEEAEAKLKKLTKKHKAKGVLIDLRNNPGGILHSAVDLTDLFLDKGMIVYTQGRNKESDEDFLATKETFFKEQPIVVLINTGSASASEILAGALQDHRRAIIAGTNSFGKGSVQTILPVSDESALKLTTARYYTPKGRSIQAQGITPDIYIPHAKISTFENQFEINEASLNNHLQGKENSNEKKKPLIDKDYQLHEALNLLKVMVLQAKDKP